MEGLEKLEEMIAEGGYGTFSNGHISISGDFKQLQWLVQQRRKWAAEEALKGAELITDKKGRIWYLELRESIEHWRKTGK